MGRLNSIIAGRQPATSAPVAPLNPYAEQPGFLGGFVASAASSLPELIGANPSDAAVAFRAANPVSGFVSQVLPTIVPYAGMYNLSKTAAGAALLNKGMSKTKALGTALGMNTVNRPVVAGAVREVLRYSPLELGRLGIGAAVNPENTGELFADVALSSIFAGGFGAAGAFLREGGQKVRALGGVPKIEGQTNLFAHPTIELRAARQEGAAVAANSDYSIQEARQKLTQTILNDQADFGYISKQNKGAAIPNVGSLEGVTNPADQKMFDVLFKPNKTRVNEDGSEIVTRSFDRRKLWEGDAKDPGTLNTGELDAVAKRAGFADAEELAENTLKARQVSIGDDRASGMFAKILNHPAVVSIEDGIRAVRQKNGATLIFKRIERAPAKPTPAEEVAEAVGITLPDAAPALTVVESPMVRGAKGNAMNVRLSDDTVVAVVRDKAPGTDVDMWFKQGPKGELGEVLGSTKEEVWAALTGADRSSALSAGKNSRKILGPSAPKQAPKPREPRMVEPGDKWIVAITDRPGRWAPKAAALDAKAEEVFATMRAAFQPQAGQNAHMFNKADDVILRIVTPQDVSRLTSQTRKTWVAETSKQLGQRLKGAAGLQNSQYMNDMADHIYDIFAPAMFKEQRNTLFARYSGLLQNRLRVGHGMVNELMYGTRSVKPGAKGVMGRHFEDTLVDGKQPFMKAMNDLTDDEFDLVIKAAMTGTPGKDIAKLQKEGLLSAKGAAAVERMQEINAELWTQIGPAFKSLGEKGQFNLKEGYIAPVIHGDWTQEVTDEAGKLIYLASGKTTKMAQMVAKAIVDEAQERGLKYKVKAASLKNNSIETSNAEMVDILEQVGKKLQNDQELTDVVQSAMKRVSFVGVRREGKLPFQPRGPGNLHHDRMNVASSGRDISYTREEFAKVVEAHMNKLSNFAAVHSFMERWGNEVFGANKNGQMSDVLYKDIMRRAQQALGIEGQITNTLNKIMTPVFGPTLGSKAATKIAAAVNSTMYTWQLAFVNPTFALLNALSPLQSVLPQVAFVLNAPGGAVNKLMHYSPLYNEAGKPIGQAGMLEPVRVLWAAMGQLRKADPELQGIHAQLRKDNVITQQAIENVQGHQSQLSSTLKDSLKNGDYARFLINGSTAMARHSEEFARLVSANAGYLVGRNQLGLQGDGLYQFTKRFVETTNYQYGQSDRARLITGPVGSVFGLFKNWQMHFMGMMLNYAGVGIKSNTWSPLLWQMGAATTLGGIGATPLRHIADGIANWHSDTDAFEYMQREWGNTAGDMGWFGPMGLLGLSLQASSTLPGTDVRNDMQMFTNSVVIERAKTLGKAVGEAWTYSKQTGENPLANSNVVDGLMNGLAPRAISRAASVVEGDYINSMSTGYPQVQNVSWAGRVVHGLGMNATEVERHQVVARELYKDQEARKQNITYYGKSYADAILNEDYDQADRVITGALALDLPLDSVMRSSDNFMRREQGDLLDRYSKDEAANARSYLGE